MSKQVAQVRVDTEVLRFLERYMLGLGRRDVLTTFANHPHRWWRLSDIAQATGRTPEQVERYVQDLAREALLQVRYDGGDPLYRLSPDRKLQNTLARIQQRLNVPASWRTSFPREGRV